MNSILNRTKGRSSRACKKTRPLGPRKLLGILRGLRTGNGPVIISVKTKQCEYPQADNHYKVDDLPRCKHMCCREGVDKAPKAPKGSFIAAASLVDSSHLLGLRGKDERVGTAKMCPAPSVPKNNHKAKIETVDLASSQASGGYKKSLPKAFRSLNRLHDNVTKGRSAAVAIKTQPSFDYTKGGQTQISFPNKDDSAKKSSDKPSTEYDADWINDLPSPSALLGNPLEKPDPLPEHASTDYDKSWPNSPCPSALIGQNDAATRNFPDTDSLEGVNLSQFNDDESDLEAAMVGLSDSVTIQEESQVQAATGQTSSQAKKNKRWCSPPDELTPKIYHRPTIHAKSSSTSKMFFSIDSPEKVEKLPQKRKEAVRDEAEDLSLSAPVPKRPRVGDERGAPQAMSNAEKPAEATSSVIKAGLPAWVYEFDPAFIAEWQDIVDFV